MRDDHFFSKLKRGPQVVLPKEFGVLIAYGGIENGDKVIDAGSGSGWLAVQLGRTVGSQGKVYSFEWREDFAKLAEGNVRKAGLEGVVEIVQKSAFDGFGVEGVDAVCLDMADSEKVLPHAQAALRMGGLCVGFLPNIEQVKEFVLQGEKLGFTHERTADVLVREWLVRDRGCRPQTTGLMHTTFVSFLRKK